MAKAIIDDSILSDIADEINDLLNENKKYRVEELPLAISDLNIVKTSNRIPTAEDGKIGDIWVVKEG